MNRFRFFSTLIILVAIIFLPYWFYLPLLLVGVVVFPFFWEGIMLALLVDLLYGWGVSFSNQFFSPIAFVVILLLIILLPLRERIRIHV